MTRQAYLLTGAVFAALCVAVWMNGYNDGVQIWGRFHWLITYEDGFIRRGMVGSIFQYFFGDRELSDQERLIVLANIGVSMTIVAVTGLWFVALLRRYTTLPNAFALIAVAALFATSQFLPTIAYNPTFSK